MTKTLYRCETKENYAEFRKEIEEKTGKKVVSKISAKIILPNKNNEIEQNG